MKKSLIIASIFAAVAFTASIFVSAEEEEQTAPLTDNAAAIEAPVASEGAAVLDTNVVAADDTETTVDTVEASFQTMDANQDGVISFEEAETNEMLISAFADLDQDKTEDLSKEEFTAFFAVTK